MLHDGENYSYEERQLVLREAKEIAEKLVDRLTALLNMEEAETDNVDQEQ